MVKPGHRTRKLRRVFVTTPGGDNKIHYKKRKPKPAKCGGCGAILKGIPRKMPQKMKNMAKTKKRPERPYGGVLCTKCMRQKIIDEQRE